MFGYEISEKVKDNIKKKKIDYKEIFVDKYLPNTKLELCEIDDLVKNCEIIFVPIQTPHEEKYEGITRIPRERADFDYSYLKSGMEALNASVEKLNKEVVVIIISTVLAQSEEKSNHFYPKTLNFVTILFYCDGQYY